MTFSSGAVWGPCFFFVHAWVLFKCSNLRKGTPVIDHRIWICGVGGQGEWPLGGVQPWNFFNENRMAFNGQPLGGPINLKMTFSDTCVSGDWFQPMIHQFKICDLSGQWLITWWCIWNPSRLCWVSQGPLWLIWHLHQTSLGHTLDLWKRRWKDKNKHLINTYDICKKDLILHVNTSLILSSQHITRVQTSPFTVNTMLITSSRTSRSESKQDGAELTTSDPSRQNVTNLHHKNSNHLTSAVFLLQTLSPCNNLTSLSADSPEHLWCVLSKKWENPFPPTWNWPWISNFSLVRWFHMWVTGFLSKMTSTPIEMLQSMKSG